MKDGEVSGDSFVEEMSWDGVTQSRPLGVYSEKWEHVDPSGQVWGTGNQELLCFQ